MTEHAGLAMNVIAIRDIAPDEEILLDYGDEWERAWQQHLKKWAPVDGARDYLSAAQLPVTPESIKTEFELLSSPYPHGASLYASMAFAGPNDGWWADWEKGTLDEYLANEGWNYEFVEVDVLDREVDDDGYTWYRVLLVNPGNDPRLSKVVTNVPLEAFRFFDRAYNTDMFQSNAFRHDIRIPDHMFPERWKNELSARKVELGHLEEKEYEEIVTKSPLNHTVMEVGFLHDMARKNSAITFACNDNEKTLY